MRISSKAVEKLKNGTAPKNLKVNGSIKLNGCTGITALPEGLTVGGYLYKDF